MLDKIHILRPGKFRRILCPANAEFLSRAAPCRFQKQLVQLGLAVGGVGTQIRKIRRILRRRSHPLVN